MVTSTDTHIGTTDKQESVPEDTSNDSETSSPPSNDEKLNDKESQVIPDECVESREDTSLKLTLSTNTEDCSDDDDDDDDEQIENTGSHLMATHLYSKPFVARFIKLSPFGSINPELPKVKIIIVGDANTGKSCFLHKYIHGYFDYQSQPTVSYCLVMVCMPKACHRWGWTFVVFPWRIRKQVNSLLLNYGIPKVGGMNVWINIVDLCRSGKVQLTYYSKLNNGCVGVCML